MVRKVTEMDLVVARDRGAQLNRPPMEVKIPELVELFEKFHQMKADRYNKHEANIEKKLSAMGDIVKAINAAAKRSSASVDLGPIMKLLNDIRKEHQAIVSDFNAHKKHCDEHDDDEPCDYKLTGKRDQRGLIDLEAGLIFTAVPRGDSA